MTDEYIHLCSYFFNYSTDDHDRQRGGLLGCRSMNHDKTYSPNVCKHARANSGKTMQKIEPTRMQARKTNRRFILLVENRCEFSPHSRKQRDQSNVRVVTLSSVLQFRVSVRFPKPQPSSSSQISAAALLANFHRAQFMCP